VDCGLGDPLADEQNVGEQDAVQIDAAHPQETGHDLTESIPS
jgi:hypothetical protein